MASFSVVVLQPGGKGCSAFIGGREDLPVVTLAGQGAVEALHLSLLPGVVRADFSTPATSASNAVLGVGVSNRPATFLSTSLPTWWAAVELGARTLITVLPPAVSMTFTLYLIPVDGIDDGSDWDAKA